MVCRIFDSQTDDMRFQPFRAHFPKHQQRQLSCVTLPQGESRLSLRRSRQAGRPRRRPELRLTEAHGGLPSGSTRDRSRSWVSAGSRCNARKTSDDGFASNRFRTAGRRSKSSGDRSSIWPPRTRRRTWSAGCRLTAHGFKADPLSLRHLPVPARLALMKQRFPTRSPRRRAKDDHDVARFQSLFSGKKGREARGGNRENPGSGEGGSRVDHFERFSSWRTPLGRSGDRGSARAARGPRGVRRAGRAVPADGLCDRPAAAGQLRAMRWS